MQSEHDKAKAAQAEKERKAAEAREAANMKAVQEQQAKTGGGTTIGAGLVCKKGPDGKVVCPQKSAAPTTPTTTTPPTTTTAPQPAAAAGS